MSTDVKIRKKRLGIVGIYDPVEREAERAWDAREREFAKAYPQYREVKWESASPKARQIAIEKAKRDLLKMGVAF